MRHYNIYRRNKGMTLLEIIIALSIVALMAGILVPSIMAYVRNAQKKADLANAKEIWTQVNELLVVNQAAYDSYYELNTGTQFFAVYEDGTPVYNPSNKSQPYTTIAKPKSTVPDKGDYWLGMIARLDGAWPDYGDSRVPFTNKAYYVWGPADDSRKFEIFTDYLNDHFHWPKYSDPGGHYDTASAKTKQPYRIKVQYHQRDDGGDLKPCRWLLTYRWGSKEAIEVWVGDASKGKNGPIARLYPRPAAYYTTGAG